MTVTRRRTTTHRTSTMASIRSLTARYAPGVAQYALLILVWTVVDILALTGGWN